jgi:flagellar biosynthesis/type III secretory pathway protein FliH
LGFALGTGIYSISSPTRKREWGEGRKEGKTEGRKEARKEGKREKKESGRKERGERNAIQGCFLRTSE